MFTSFLDAPKGEETCPTGEQASWFFKRSQEAAESGMRKFDISGPPVPLSVAMSRLVEIPGK